MCKLPCVVALFVAVASADHHPGYHAVRHSQGDVKQKLAFNTGVSHLDLAAAEELDMHLVWKRKRADLPGEISESLGPVALPKALLQQGGDDSLLERETHTHKHSFRLRSQAQRNGPA